MESPTRQNQYPKIFVRVCKSLTTSSTECRHKHYVSLMTRTQVVSVYLDHTNRLTFKRVSCIKLNTVEFICIVILQSHGAVTGVGQGCELGYDTEENNGRQLRSGSCHQPFHFRGTSFSQPLKKTCQNFQIILIRLLVRSIVVSTERLWLHLDPVCSSSSHCVMYIWYDMRQGSDVRNILAINWLRPQC